jgi:hypothetical protein
MAGTTVGMATSEAWRDTVDFLVKSENIESAFDLYEAVPLAIDRLHVKFWRTVKDIVERELRKRKASDWIARLEPAEASEFLKPGYQYLEIAPADPDDLPAFWAVWLEQAYESGKKGKDDAARLWYGVGFHPAESRTRTRFRAEVKAFQDRFGKEWISYASQLNDGWIARKDLDCALRSRSATIRLALGDSLEEEIATSVFQLFDENRKKLEAINGGIRKSKP